MTLGKAEAGETLELLPDLVGGRTGDPVSGHPLIDLALEPGHCLIRPFVGHRLTETIGLRSVETSTDPGQLHQLLLEDGYTQRLLEDRLGRGMGIAHRLLAVASPQIRVNRLPLDRPGPDEGHLNCEVVEGLWLHLGQGRHLRP